MRFVMRRDLFEELEELEEFEEFEGFHEFEGPKAPPGAARACCARCAAHQAEFEFEDAKGSGNSLPGLSAGTSLLLVGDSHTHGPFGVELERLLTQAGASVSRQAKIGSAVKYWFRLLPGLLRQHRPSVVIVGLGANMRDYPSARGTSAQIAKTVALIRHVLPAARIVWVGPPRRRSDTDEKLARFNRIIQVGLKGKATFIDSAPYTPRYEGRDGVHYAAKPAQRWAQHVFGALGRALSSR